MNNQVKTLEEHKIYGEQMARLAFYFAKKWLAPRNPEKTMSELLREHTPLFYHALHFTPGTWMEIPGCVKIMEQADLLADLSPEDFEEEMWKFTCMLSRVQAESNYPVGVAVNTKPGWNCGTLKYDPPTGTLAEEGKVVFHISNAIGPHSIFEDPSYLAYCFLLVMKETEMRYGSHTLYTSTWLNNRQQWLDLFPAEWQENMEAEDEAGKLLPPWHFGWWGQIVTKRGTIAPAMDQYIRENGRLKYACKTSQCSFRAMREHLKQFI